jgi:hypothetical protein
MSATGPRSALGGASDTALRLLARNNFRVAASALKKISRASRIIWLLPAKHLRRERRAQDKRQGQCHQVARVRPPRVALPNPFEQ